MQRGVAALISGMMAEQAKLEIVTNNLANVSTSGFKRQECLSTDFSVLMKNARQGASAAARDALMRASGMENRFQDGTAVTALTIMEQGEQQQTGNPFDLALEGDGLFCLEAPQGTVYTRNGQFHIDQEGYLVSAEGYKLLGEGGPVLCGGESEENKPIDLKVDEEGNIFYGRQRAGALSIARAENPVVLARMGESLFMTKDGSRLPETKEGYRVHQGFVELSNVSVITEMARMIQIHRTFETYEKMFQQYDQLRGRLIDQVSRST
jgi:flagellar basal-body rod protein FlgF